LEKLATILEKNQVPFHKWIEQPENIPTCIATAPLKERNAEVLEAFKKGCSLYR
jgi:hypothetical protein